MTTDFEISMYNHFLEMYQERYISKVTVITWKHISYWRKMLTHYGKILIQKGVLAEAKFKADKQNVLLPVGYTTENLILLQENIPNEN